MISKMFRGIKVGVNSDVRKLRSKLRRLYQTVTRGYPDEDIYDLTDATSKFILPRLERLALNYKACVPYLPKKEIYMDEQKWRLMLDDMIYAFENTRDGDRNYSWVDKKRVKRGLKYFAKYYRFLGF